MGCQFWDLRPRPGTSGHGEELLQQELRYGDCIIFQGNKEQQPFATLMGHRPAIVKPCHGKLH